jgi:chromosome partitioning protein
VQLIREAQQFKPKLKAVFTINRKIANTAIGRDVAGALAQFEDMPVRSPTMSQRVIYAESAGQGLAVIEAEPNSEAAREIARLVQQMIETLTLEVQHEDLRLCQIASSSG